jgi:ribosomal protein L10
MDRAQKQESIESLKSVFADAGAVVVTHYMGLTVAEMTDLRLRLRKEGAAIKVVKNTLALKALDGKLGDTGSALFTGPVAIAYGPDAVSAAKVAVQFAKENDKLKIVGGVLDQTNVLDEPQCVLWRLCRRWTNCVASLSASSRLRRPRSLASCRLRLPSWLAFSTPTRPKTPRNGHPRISIPISLRN